MAESMESDSGSDTDIWTERLRVGEDEVSKDRGAKA
jgi:hypothetical protein